MYLAKKKHKPRYQMLMKIGQLSSQLQQVVALAKNLKSDKVIFVVLLSDFIIWFLVSQDSVEKAAKKIQDNIDDVLKKIKSNENIRVKDMEKYYQALVDQIGKEVSNVKAKVKFSFI